jgi:hypothetical protein
MLRLPASPPVMYDETLGGFLCNVAPMIAFD